MVADNQPTMLSSDGECSIDGVRYDCDGECIECELYNDMMEHRSDPCNGCIDAWCCFYLITKNINRACGTKLCHVAQRSGIDGDELN